MIGVEAAGEEAAAAAVPVGSAERWKLRWEDSFEVVLDAGALC